MEGQEKRVGVFMLVFRDEPRMHRAVKSILNQTYTNFKFYILNSEATRPSMLEYAKQDARVCVMEAKEGDYFVTCVKDIAKENAYVTVLDADDWCEENYIECMLMEAEARGVDIVACGNSFVSEKQVRVSARVAPPLEWSVKQTNQNLGHIYGFFRTIWGKLIKSRVALACDFSLLPEINTYGLYGQDTLMAFLMLECAEKLYICDKVLYNYQLSETGETYRLREGRLDSDEVLFCFVEKLLMRLGDYGEPARSMLLMVYRNALIDTLKLILRVDWTESERVDKLLYVLDKDLSKEMLEREIFLFGEFGTVFYPLLFREELGEVQEEPALLGYKEILERIYPSVKGILDFSEFKLLLKNKRLLDALVLKQYQELTDMLLALYKTLDRDEKTVCQKLLLRLSKNKVFRAALEEEEIIINHDEILRMICRGENEAAFYTIKQLLFGDNLPEDAEHLVNLWTTMAAVTETVEEFVLAKQTKVEILWIQNKKEDAKKEYWELQEFGIRDDNMTYLENLLLSQE